MANRSIQRDRACRQCGISPITGYKFCSRRCRWTAIERRKGAKPLAEEVAARKAAAFKRECSECFKVFNPGRAKIALEGEKVRGKFCSARCARMDQIRAGRVTKEAKVFARWKRNADARERQRLKVVGKKCRDCGLDVPKFTQRCDPCRDVAEARNKEAQKQSPVWRKARRAAKARRRAVERGIEAERFDPLEILSRDGWKCHICGCKTPKRLRGTYDDRAPELDHIIPLAAGGKHTRQNTACACRKCNALKGDKALGQLLLLAA